MEILEYFNSIEGTSTNFYVQLQATLPPDSDSPSIATKREFEENKKQKQVLTTSFVRTFLSILHLWIEE